MPSNSRRSAWYASLEAHCVLVHLMDSEMHRDCGIPLEWYDVLIKLWLAPGKRLRMSELADQVLLSRSWLTRRVIQLEKAGLVTRCPAGPEDRRGILATMTKEGERAFASMEKSHSSSIEAHFSQFVSEQEAAVIRACFGRIARQGRESLRAPLTGTRGGHR